MPSRSLAWVAPSMVAGGSALTVLSGPIIWYRVLGSDLSGFRAADLAIGFSGTASWTPPAWIGLVWYALPLCAAGVWVVLFASWPVRVRAVHGYLVAVQALVVGAVVVTIAGGDSVSFGPGVAVAAVGVAQSIAGLVIASRAASPDRR